MPKGPHVRVTIGGVFGSAAAPIEAWQIGFNCDADNVPQVGEYTDAGLLASATTIKNAFDGQMVGALQAGTVSTFCDVRFVGADGKQPRTPEGGYAFSARYENAAPIGAAGSPKYPFQTALVVTLDTERQGPTGKGRVFLPPPNFALGADGLLSVADAQEMRDNVASTITAINTAMNAYADINNVSVLSSKGFSSPVTSVRCGRALDTMRSRRRDLLEKYTNPQPV